MSAGQIIVDYVCPAVGSLLSTIMAGSPIIAVREMQRTNKVGEINPFPFCALFNMTLAFTLYGFLIDNIFISVANFLGMAFALYFIGHTIVVTSSNLTLARLNAEHPALGLIDAPKNGDKIPNDEEKLERQLDMCVNTLWVVGLFWGAVGILCFNGLGPTLNPGNQEAVGPFANAETLIFGVLTIISTIVFFASPLSTIKKVVETKDSSSIDPPLVICALVNCTLWTIYGIAGPSDPVVYGPNATGMFLQSINLLVMFTYPKKTAMAEREDSVEVTNAGSKSGSISA